MNDRTATGARPGATLSRRSATLVTGPIFRTAVRDSFVKLDPRRQIRNPVMFVVLLGSVLTTVLAIAALTGQAPEVGRPWFVVAIALWLWLTVLFANFAEAVAEGRGKAQADALRATRRDVHARRLIGRSREQGFDRVPASSLRRDDVVYVEASETIPADGEVIDGVASVDESSITGESAQVIREAGSDFSSVTGGTSVI